jgi:acetyl esterase/lipase
MKDMRTPDQAGFDPISLPMIPSSILLCLAFLFAAPAPGQEMKQKNLDESEFKVMMQFDVTYGYGACLDEHGVQYLMPLKLDVYFPINCSSSRKPALVLIHGAVWGAGSHSKRDEHLIRAGKHFAARGGVSFSINFRTGKQTPDCHGDNFYLKCQRASYVDAKAAVRWIRDHADFYGIDPHAIAAYGGSSGAGSALMLAITDPMDYATDYPGGQIPSYNTPHGDPSVQACMEFWGTCFDKYWGNPPVHYLFDFSFEFDATDPPIMISHGTDDIIIPYVHATVIKKRCEDFGIFHRLFTLEGAGHGEWNFKYGDPPKGLNTLAEEFLRDDLGWNLK